MFTTITYIIIGILVLDYLIERVLAYLNTRNVKSELPIQLKGLYDADKYAKQQAYFKENQRFGAITSSFSLILILMMFLVGGFALIDGLAQQATELKILVSIIFFGVIFFANDLLTIPFEIYDQFVIEQRYGFNKATPKIFIGDKLKGWLLGALIGGGLIALISKIYDLTADYFWILAWVVMSILSIFLMMFYSQLIVPLFNKQTPLEDGELRVEIEKFSEKAGFKLNNIFVMDGSKRSTKANAYFSGLGAKKRIVLFDTLINDLSTQEIVAVLAHEVGHSKKKHTLLALGISLLSSLVMLYILGYFLNNDALAQAFGIEKANFHINILAFGILYTPVSVVLSLLAHIVSRRNEYQADAYAAEFGLGGHLVEGLKKLNVKSLSNLQPHPAYVFFYHSHPTLLQRMEAINKIG